jgi:hypothetical protein
LVLLPKNGNAGSVATVQSFSENIDPYQWDIQRSAERECFRLAVYSHGAGYTAD